MVTNGTADRTPPRPAERRLLTALLLDAGKTVPTDVLIDRLWGDSPPATARNTLQAHVSALRRSLPGVVASTGGGYRLDIDGHGWDVGEFDALATEAHERDAIDAARHAVALWRGEPFMELPDVDAARIERQRLTTLKVQVEEMLATTLIRTGEYVEATALLQRLVVERPFHEPFWEQLVEAHAAAGRRAEALMSFREAADLLAEELGIQPGSRLRRLAAEIADGDRSPQGKATAAALPDAATSFVGRAAELDVVTDLVDHNDVVTILGGPGLGKSRLAAELGHRLLDRYPGGVWFVRLAGCRTATDVSATIAATTGASRSEADLEELLSTLEADSLLILDNCEHVIDAVRRVLGPSDRRGEVRVLATSRTALGVPGERVWRLEPLAVPESGRDIVGNPSVRLLVDRAAVVAPGFRVTSSNSEQVAALCRRAGGVPLAIELAATWVATVSLDEISPAEPARAVDPPPGAAQHGSVDQAIAWSLDSLGEKDQTTFEATSVFAGSFDLAAFAAVCFAGGPRQEARRSVAALLGASLLTTEDGEFGTLRYRMLEPLKETARSRLEERQRRAVERRHADWFLRRADEVADAANGPEEAGSFRQVDDEIADFRQAMRFHLDAGEHSTAARIATSLARYWFARYLGWEAQRWLDDVLGGELDAGTRLRTLIAAGWAAYGTASYQRAADLYDQAIALAVDHGDRLRKAEATYGLARVHLNRRIRDGETLLAEALTTFDDLGAVLQSAQCRLWLGIRAAAAGESPEARRRLTDAVADLDTLGHRSQVSIGHRYLSMAAWYDDDEATARRHLAISEEAARNANDQRAIGGALIQRSLVEARWGDPAVAAAAIVRALAPIPDGNEIDACLVALGALPVLLATDRNEMAARLLAHLDRTYEAYGWTPLDERIPAVATWREAIADEFLTQPPAIPGSSVGVIPDLVVELEDIASGRRRPLSRSRIRA